MLKSRRSCLVVRQPCLALAAVYSVLYPGPSGDWIGVVVLAAYAVNVPIGLVSLGVGLFVKRGAARLRGPCIVVALIVLCLPFWRT